MTDDERNAIINEHSARLTAALSDLIDGKIVLALDVVAVFAQPIKGVAITHINVGKEVEREIARKAAAKIHNDRMPEPDVERLGEHMIKPRN